MSDHFLAALFDGSTAYNIHVISTHINKSICNKNSLPSRESLKGIFGFFVNDAA